MPAPLDEPRCGRPSGTHHRRTPLGRPRPAYSSLAPHVWQRPVTRLTGQGLSGGFSPKRLAAGRRFACLTTMVRCPQPLSCDQGGNGLDALVDAPTVLPGRDSAGTGAVGLGNHGSRRCDSAACGPPVVAAGDFPVDGSRGSDAGAWLVRMPRGHGSTRLPADAAANLEPAAPFLAAALKNRHEVTRLPGGAWRSRRGTHGRDSRPFVFSPRSLPRLVHLLLAGLQSGGQVDTQRIPAVGGRDSVVSAIPGTEPGAGLNDWPVPDAR
jgi:hypothetical protein